MVTGQAGDDERALSSVLGIVLMVAVTIILAAVVGVFVLGIGEQLTSESPQSTLDFSFSTEGANNSVIILHGGGDDLQPDEVIIRSGGDDVWGGTVQREPGWGSGDSITTADQVEIEDENIDAGDQLIVIWSDGQRSAILAEETVP